MGPPLDDETFFVEYTIDEEDDWKAEASLLKANPNYDVSVTADFLKSRQRDAVATPRKAGVEESHSRLHNGSASPSGTYSIEKELSETQFNKLSAWIKRFAGGGDLTGTPLILDNGAKWLSQQMSGVDQQHLETRRFQIEEVCRSARVMPIMVGQSDKASTYASAEQMFLAHEVHTLAPRAVALEQSAEVALLTPAEKAEGLTIRFNLSAMRRGDYKGRQEGLAIQRRNGVINADEWRDLEDMNPREDPGGQQYVIEGNMAVQDGRDLTPIASTTPAKA